MIVRVPIAKRVLPTSRPGRGETPSSPWIADEVEHSRFLAPICSRTTAARERGAILLEVILALVLLAGAAAIVGAGLGSSVDAVVQQRLNIHAANLATTVLSELQLGLRTPGNGAETFEAPFEHWTWEIQMAPMESEQGQATKLSLAEVVIRHDDPVVVHRLAQVVRSDGVARSIETRATP